MNNIKKLAIIFSFLLISCESTDLEKYDLNIEFQNQFEADNTSFPDVLRDFINYRETKVCKGKVFLPKITVKRLDAEKSEQLEYPFSTQAKLQYKMGMLSAQNVIDGYQVDELKLPEFVMLPKNEIKAGKKLRPATKNVLIIHIDDDTKKIKEALKQFDKMLCEGVKNITIKVSQEIVEEPEIDETNDEAEGQKDEEKEVTDNTNEPEEKPKNTGETDVPKPKGGKTVVIGGDRYTKQGSNYITSFAAYVGGVNNGKANGQGTMTFKRDHLIPVPSYSQKKIMAKKGYRLAGRFKNGYITSGVLYNAKGQKVKSIFVGR